MSDPMNDDPTMPDDDDAREDILAAELSLGLLSGDALTQAQRRALLANGLKIGTCGLPK